MIATRADAPCQVRAPAGGRRPPCPSPRPCPPGSVARASRPCAAPGRAPARAPGLSRGAPQVRASRDASMKSAMNTDAGGCPGGREGDGARLAGPVAVVPVELRAVRELLLPRLHVDLLRGLRGRRRPAARGQRPRAVRPRQRRQPTQPPSLTHAANPATFALRCRQPGCAPGRPRVGGGGGGRAERGGRRTHRSRLRRHFPQPDARCDLISAGFTGRAAGISTRRRRARA